MDLFSSSSCNYSSSSSPHSSPFSSSSFSDLVDEETISRLDTVHLPRYGPDTSRLFSVKFRPKLFADQSNLDSEFESSKNSQHFIGVEKKYGKHSEMAFKRLSFKEPEDSKYCDRKGKVPPSTSELSSIDDQSECSALFRRSLNHSVLTAPLEASFSRYSSSGCFSQAPPRSENFSQRRRMGNKPSLQSSGTGSQSASPGSPKFVSVLSAQSRALSLDSLHRAHMTDFLSTPSYSHPPHQSVNMLPALPEEGTVTSSASNGSESNVFFEETDMSTATVAAASLSPQDQFKVRAAEKLVDALDNMREAELQERAKSRDNIAKDTTSKEPTPGLASLGSRRFSRSTLDLIGSWIGGGSKRRDSNSNGESLVSAPVLISSTASTLELRDLPVRVYNRFDILNGMGETSKLEK